MSRALLLAAFIAAAGCQTSPEGTALPKARYLEHPPRSFAATQTLPMPKEVVACENAPQPLLIRVGGMMAAQAGPGLHPSAPASPPAPTLAPLPPPSPAAPTARLLTIANVHKEAVMVFKVAGGALTFVQKVGPGDAIDVPVLAGDKLAATFSTAPHCASYEAKSVQGEVWLLRPDTSTSLPPRVVPCTTAGGPPGGPPPPPSGVGVSYGSYSR